MKKENVRFIIKKVLAFFLSVVLGFQIGIMPVQAAALSENLQLSTEIKDDKNSTTIKDSESVETNTEKEAVTIIESSSEKIQSTGFDEQKESQDAKSEEKAIFNKKSQENSLEEISIDENSIDENSIDENSLKEKQYKDLTKEQIDIAKRMDLGETYIYNLPKTNYKSGDQIDISSIEIIAKDKAGNVDLLNYSDLVNNKNIKMNLHQGDEILSAYYNDLFDDEYLKYETEDIKQDISNYLKENNIKEYKPSLTIKIQNFEPINIEFNLEEDLDLSPLELFYALKMEKASMRLLTSEGLTIKDNQNIKLDGFRFVIKDEKGLLKVISGKELEKESIKVDFSKLNEDKKSLKDDFIQSYIILQKEGFEKLYIPITILSDNIDAKSISGNSNLDFIVLNQEKNENNIILNSIIDVKDIKDVKSFNVEFFNENGTSENSKIKILKVIKTNGYNDEDILLDMPHSRDVSEQQKYTDSSKFEISKKLKNLATSNSILFSNNFEVGYKYLITLEIAGADKSSELITKITLDKFDYENIKTEEIQHNTKLESLLIPNTKINDSLQVRSFSIPNLLATRATNYGEFTLNKVDAKDNTGLPNAKFTLTNSSGISNIFTTNENGQINISNLEPDTYRLRETQAPDGYIGSLEEWSIYVNSLGRTFITELGEIAPGNGTGSDFGVIVGQDVTSKIQLMGNIGYTDQNNDGQLNMGTDENNITISMNMIIDGPVNPGDYFTIKESDSLHYNMLQPDRRTYPTIVDKSGLVLAYPTFSPDFDIEKGLNKEITYVFTEAVAGNNLTELTMTWVHSVNVNIASYNGMYNFGVTIGENSIATDIRVAHTSPFSGKLENSKVNIKAAYLYTNDTNGKYTQIAYINPLKADVRGASNLIIYPGDSNDKFNMADVQEGKTKITLYRFRDGVSIPHAVIFDKTNLELVSEDQYRISFLPGASVNAAKLDFNNEIRTSTYLVMVESEMRYPNTDTNINTKVTQFIDYTTRYNGVRDFVNYGNTYNTNVSGGSGGGLSDYEPPTLDVPNIKRDVTAQLVIKKTDEGGNINLKGATFTLTDSYGKVVEQTTGEDGKTTFGGLKVGKYELAEIKAPSGYEKVEGTWEVTVTEDGKALSVTVKEPESTQINTTYDISNKKGERLYYYNAPLLDLQTTVEQIEGTDRFRVNVLYKGRASYNYQYNLTIRFDIENFEILSNNVNNGRFVATILSGESNPSGVYSFTVKPKNPQNNVTLTPINSIDYNNLYLSSSRYPTINPRLGQAGGQTTMLSPIEGSTSVFEYSIANKPGKDKFSLIKKDINGNPLQGVEFELLGSDREVIRKETTDSEGRIVFDNLSYGQYWFRETKTLPGYILDDTLIPVLLGKDWKVPINPQNPKDVSDAITIDTNKINSMTTTTGDKYTVYPNKTEGLIMGVNFTVNQNQIINPGDTFTIKLNENVDLDGIGNADDRRFDIVASSGLIAKAKISADRRSIEYTFTEYVKFNELKGFKVNIPMFIDRIAIKNNTKNVPISIQIGDETNKGGKFEDSINVDYENYISDPETVKTYITKNNQESGTFTAVLYVNPQNYKNFNRYLEFTSNQLIDIDNIEVYYSPNGGGSESLPWSYGIDNTKLNKINNSVYNYNQNAKLVSFNLGNNASTNAYVIKIEGRFDKEADEFITNSYYYRDLEFFDYWGTRYFERYIDKWQTFVKFYYPDSSVEGQVLFNIVNIKNKIEYIKVEGNIINTIPQDASDSVVYANDTKASSLIRLMGAKFQLKFEKDGAWENYGEEITSDGSGKFSWEGLPSGKYQVWETQAPEGYITPKDYVSSFIVDERGNITDILNNTTIIPNEKESMKFFVDKIWQDEQKNNHSIVNGTLELELTAPQGATFPDDIKVDQENSHIIDRKYKITKISDDNRTITIEIDLKTAFEGVNSVTDETKAIKIIVPTNWPSGDYILKETKAPIGYIMGMQRYTLSVDWNNKIIKYGDTVLYSKDGDNEIFKVLNIVNERGKYPSTGGFGTAIYTLIGFALMGIAFIEYKRKKVINST